MMTINIFVSAQDLYLLMTRKSYTHIRIYQSDTEDGTYTEITNSSTRPSLQIGTTTYRYVVEDVDEDEKWFHYTFANDDDEESSESDPFQNQPGDPEKIGYTFNNYTHPLGSFGSVLTADDMRYTFLWGIDAIASDDEYSSWLDEQSDVLVRSAAEDFERYLGIDIYRRKYKTNPTSTDVKVNTWMDGDSNIYTDEEFGYDFEPDTWLNYGFMQLRHFPIINVSRATLVGPTEASILDLIPWMRVEKNTGQLHYFPKNQMLYGPFLGAYGTVLLWQMKRYPQGFEVDYETGYTSADKVPSDLRDVIGKWAACKMLNVIGDGLLPGFSSQSLSLDGLSEAFSSTQSATSAYFGARIQTYKKDIDDWLQRNKYKYSSIPLGFVRGS